MNTTISNLEEETQKKIIDSQNILQKTYKDDNWYNVKYSSNECEYWYKIPQWLLRYHRNKTELKILDIGCAYGTLAVFSKKNFDSDVYAIDVYTQEELLKLFKEMGIKYKNSNIEKESIPYNEKFDIIIFTEVFEHLNYNPIKTLIKIKNALNENGVIYFSTPNSRAWGKTKKYYDKFSNIPEYSTENKNDSFINDHIWQYNLEELIYCFNKSGLIPVDIDYPDNKKRHFNIALKRTEDIII